MSLIVDIINSRGEVDVRHVFYGADEDECESKRQTHLAGCDNFQRAEEEDRVREYYEEIPDDEVPDEAFHDELEADAEVEDES
jgi:hypothetical protein